MKYRRITYTYAFSTRVKKKIFNIEGVEKLFILELENLYVQEKDINILDVKCNSCYVILQVELPNTVCPSKFIHSLMSHTSTSLRGAFPQLAKIPSLWEKDFLIDTNKTITNEFIQYFLDYKKINEKEQLSYEHI